MFSFPVSDDDDELTIEESAIMQYCHDNSSWNYCRVKTPPMDSIPVGSVAWCEQVYGCLDVDYYPVFMKDRLCRNTWKSDIALVDTFIKPCACKKWDGYVFVGDEKAKEEPYWCSDIVHFTNEWRYYMADGRVVASAWYDGDCSDEDVLRNLTKPAPMLDVYVPDDYCGVLDMGEISGKSSLVLVEACHPYAIGWYSESNVNNYAEFLIAGHGYLKKLNACWK